MDQGTGDYSGRRYSPTVQVKNLASFIEAFGFEDTMDQGSHLEAYRSLSQLHAAVPEEPAATGMQVEWRSDLRISKVDGADKAVRWAYERTMSPNEN